MLTRSRANCDYSVAGIRKTVPAAAMVVPVEQTRRYYRRAARFCSMYHHEAALGIPIPFKIREYTMKKYARHRGVPDGVLAAVDKDLDDKLSTLQDRVTRLGGGASVKRLARAGGLQAGLATYSGKLATVKATMGMIRKRYAMPPLNLRFF